MRRSALSSAVVGLALSLTAGCRASLPGTGEEPSAYQWIMREEIEEPRFATAYDVVRTLRSNWLSSRGLASFRYRTEVQVYLDGVHMGGVQALQDISTPSIQYLRYINGIDASARWGVGHGRGVIFVGTGPPPDPSLPPQEVTPSVSTPPRGRVPSPR